MAIPLNGIGSVGEPPLYWPLMLDTPRVSRSADRLGEDTQRALHGMIDSMGARVSGCPLSQLLNAHAGAIVLFILRRS